MLEALCLIEGKMAELKFEVDVARIGGHYGLSLVILENGEKDEEAPIFCLVFLGAPGQDPVVVARQFGVCHQEAMETVGLDGILTPDEIVEKLEASILLAGELMERHDLRALEMNEIDEGVLAALFAEEPPTNPSLLN